MIDALLLSRDRKGVKVFVLDMSPENSPELSGTF